MARYRCPECKKGIELRRIYDGRFLARCLSCNFTSIGESGATEMDSAYVDLLDAHDKDPSGAGQHFERLLESANLVRSSNDIKSIIRQEKVSLDNIPTSVRKILTGRDHYLVTYKLMPESMPSVASNDPFGLHPDLLKALSNMGIAALFAFQTKAIEAILDGKNVVIVAPTGTGKTEAFILPIVQKISEQVSGLVTSHNGSGEPKALFVYPTKALARDQEPKLERFASALGLRHAIWDGDTPSQKKDDILDEPPHIILTNFDTLHRHLMHRTALARLLRNIRYLIVDEAHVYTGTFGSNVHFIIERLKRFTGPLQIVAASATISNALVFCKTLFGCEFEQVECSEGKRGRTHMVMVFPSLQTHRKLVDEMLKMLLSDGYKTLSFSSSHLGAELVAFFAKKGGLPVDVHRAGLLRSDRLEVESQFKAGKLRGLAATPTLELGIDIGDVDAVISDLVSVTRLTQRAGRAGRRGQESIALIALRENDPISQYYRTHPDHYFQDLESGYVDPLNPTIAKMQLLAASLDRPLGMNEFHQFQKHIDELVKNGSLIHRSGQLQPVYSVVRNLMAGYDIRAGGDNIIIRLGKRKIGDRSLPQALGELHPQGVYFHGGTRYRSLKLKIGHNGGLAEVEKLPTNYPYYTRSLMEEQAELREVYEDRLVYGLQVIYGELRIKKTVVGYVNVEPGKDSSTSTRIALPESIDYEFYTKGLLFRAPRPSELLQGTKEEMLGELEMSSYHASEHVLIEGTNSITGGVARDMGGISLGNTGLIFIHDSSRGGNGASHILFERLEEALLRAQAIVNACICKSVRGCPRCTFSYRCGNNNDHLNREGAVEVIRRILAQESTNLDEVLSMISI